MVELALIPFSRENEMAALGSMILNQAIAVEILTTLSAMDFYQPRNGKIFDAVSRVITSGEAVDPISVGAALGDDFERVGGHNYLHECLSATPNVLSGPLYARLIADDATRRRLIQAGAEIQQRAISLDNDVPTVVDQAEQAVLAASRLANRREAPTHIAAVGAEALAKLVERVENGADPGIPTGLLDYDRLVTHRAGQMIVVGGRPGMGKSTLTQQIALHSAYKKNRKTVIISLEMPRDDMVLRLASDLAEIDSAKIDRGTLDQRELKKVLAIQDQWQQWPLDIVDWCRTLPAIRNYLRRYATRNGGIDLFVIDFLQNIEPTESDFRVETRNLIVGRWADQLKSLALELEAVAIVASQLKRLEEDKIPGMSDLRESGQIEQSADVVNLLHRHDYYNPDKEPGTAKIIVAKHRRGPTNTIRVGHQLHFSRFVNLARTADLARAANRST